MKNQEITQRILNELGLSARYSGYIYILHAIDLISKNESLVTQTTKVLYVDIATKCSTTALCVERNIRYSIELIWRHADKCSYLIQRIFGHNYLYSKPSNKVFLELLYNYVKILESKNLHSINNICPLFGCECQVLKKSKVQL